MEKDGSLMTHAHVYHFTDTVRLPWIISTGVLRPTDNPHNGYPNPDFLWATIDSRGCPSATLVNRKELYKNGIIQLVRFTLSAEDFSGWPQIAEDHPDWTALHISTLNRFGVQLGDDPRKWRCRIGSLPISHWLAIHARSYRDNRWVEISRAITTTGSADTKSISLPEFGKFTSRQFKQPDGKTAYTLRG